MILNLFSYTTIFYSQLHSFLGGGGKQLYNKATNQPASQQSKQPSNKPANQLTKQPTNQHTNELTSQETS